MEGLFFCVKIEQMRIVTHLLTLGLVFMSIYTVQAQSKIQGEFTAGTTLVRSFSYNERKIKSIFKEKKVADPKFSTTFYGGMYLKWSL